MLTAFIQSCYEAVSPQDKMRDDTGMEEMKASILLSLGKLSEAEALYR